MKQYTELRRLAEAATKCYGAMRVEKDYNGVYQVVGAGSWNILSAWHTPDGKSKDNAEFHAASSPDAVLELIAEVESLKKDAARYRWLRDESIDPGSVIDKKIGHSYVGDYPIYEYRAGQELDDAIDAEMIEVNNK